MTTLKIVSVILINGIIAFNLNACSETNNQTNAGKTSSDVDSRKDVDTLRFIKETPSVFKTPESVKYDKTKDILYVANINGKPTEKDGNGFISKLNIEGQIIDLKWITELNAPKGMGIFDDKLYVTDIDELVEISISEGKITHRFSAKDAEFLNDIDIDKNGNIYVSDMFAGKIWMLKNNTFEIWLDSEELIGPNGLFVKGENLLIGTKTKILSVNLKSKKINNLIENTGSIDGLEFSGDDKYLFSDWSGHVYIAKAGGEKKLLLNTSEKKINAADIEFIRDKQLLLIPTFYHHTVSFYKLVKL